MSLPEVNWTPIVGLNRHARSWFVIRSSSFKSKENTLYTLGFWRFLINWGKNMGGLDIFPYRGMASAGQLCQVSGLWRWNFPSRNLRLKIKSWFLKFVIILYLLLKYYRYLPKSDHNHLAWGHPEPQRIPISQRILVPIIIKCTLYRTN